MKSEDEVFNIENVLILAFEITYREDTDTEEINIFYVNKDDYIGIESIFIPYNQISNYNGLCRGCEIDIERMCGV